MTVALVPPPPPATHPPTSLRDQPLVRTTVGVGSATFGILSLFLQGGGLPAPHLTPKPIESQIKSCHTSIKAHSSFVCEYEHPTSSKGASCDPGHKCVLPLVAGCVHTNALTRRPSLDPASQQPLLEGVPRMGPHCRSRSAVPPPPWPGDSIWTCFRRGLPRP